MRATGLAIALLLGSLLAAGSRAQVFTFTLFAGGARGSMDGTLSEARFGSVPGLAFDHQGNSYVADADNHAIRKISPSGIVTTLAGNPQEYFPSAGAGVTAGFMWPHALVADRSDNVYVVDVGWILKVTPAGVVTIVSADLHANAIAITADDDLVVACEDGVIRKITPGGDVTIIASLDFDSPRAIAVDRAGTAYVAVENEIDKISPSGAVTLLAADVHEIALAVHPDGSLYASDGSSIVKIAAQGEMTTVAGAQGQHGFSDGRGAVARFASPLALAFASDGSLYVADAWNNSIRKVMSDGTVTTITGGGGGGYQDGIGQAAVFSFAGGDFDLNGIAADADGNLYVTDAGNNTIRKITPQGEVTTLAGRAGEAGSRDDGAATRSLFSRPAGVAVDDLGNVYVADRENKTIRKIVNGSVTTIAGKPGVPGDTDGMGSAARFTDPVGIAVDASRNVYVTDNQTVREITPDGAVITLAGVAGRGGAADGAGSTARFWYPIGITVGVDGLIYVVDEAFGGRVLAVSRTGLVKTIARNTPGDPVFHDPIGITADRNGNLYVTDSEFGLVERVATDGAVTLAGGGGFGPNGDGTGSDAAFYRPSGIVADAAGSLYVVSIENVSKGVPALPDNATIDKTAARPGELRHLYGPASATTWSWKIIRYPSASHARLSSTTERNPTFVPDVADLYIFQVTATDGVRSSISTVSLTVTSGERRHSVSH